MFSFFLKVKHLECLLVEGVSSALKKGGKICRMYFRAQIH